MVKVSKPLTASQVATYYRTQYAATTEKNYYAASATVTGQWHGTLAKELGLVGDVDQEHFLRLANSLHPHDPNIDLLRRTKAQTYLNAFGETVTSKARRAAYDITISAPKGVSAAALVGGDHRLIEAHRRAVAVTADSMERYTDARMGGSRPAERTAKWIVAAFEHDSSRPVDGYSAPQLHTHLVVFNVTRTDQEKFRAIQPREFYRAQQFATAVYRAELAVQLKAAGYLIERGASREPKIVGFTDEYIKVLSPRREQIKQEMAARGLRGAAAADVVALNTRDAKIQQTPEEVLRQHLEVAEQHGGQPARIVAEALERNYERRYTAVDQDLAAGYAVRFAKAKGVEREAVVEERKLLTFALDRGQGETTLGPVQREVERLVASGILLERGPAPGATAGRSITTPEMVAAEQTVVDTMRAGQSQHGPLASHTEHRHIERTFAHLNADQMTAVHQLLDNRDQVFALHGKAGVGKTFALAAVKTIADKRYEVVGLAPTAKAAINLAGSGIESKTLQSHLVGGVAITDRPKFYVLDEAGLADTQAIKDFVTRLRPDDRALLVGDTRQHQAINAGKPFEFLMEAGMRTVDLSTIVRQKNPELLQAVEMMASGDARGGLQQLNAMGKMVGIRSESDRLAFTVAEFMKDPQHTVVIAPENETRKVLNAAIHAELQAVRLVDPDHARTVIYVDSQKLTRAERAYAGSYADGQVLRYVGGSDAIGIEAGEYGEILKADKDANLLTVKMESGRTVTYDPKRLYGVNVYDTEERAFAPGDRIQFTAKARDLGVVNRTMGTLNALDGSQATVTLDGGRKIRFDVTDQPHLDMAYALTSYVVQSETAKRSILYVDNTRAHENIVNARTLYVGASRGVDEVIVVTDEKVRALTNLSRDISERIAMEAEIPQPEHVLHP